MLGIRGEEEEQPASRSAVGGVKFGVSGDCGCCWREGEGGRAG